MKVPWRSGGAALALGCLGAVVSVAACKARREGSTLRDAEADARQEALGASDLSILVPLQGMPAASPGDSPLYGMRGTGMCSAPLLSEGAINDPIVGRDLFKQWVMDVLVFPEPLPALRSDGWKREDIDVAALYRRRRDEAAKLDVDKGSCPVAIGTSDFTDDTQKLLATHTHVALKGNIVNGACRYANWRVVSARLDPCSYRAKIAKDTPALLSAANSNAAALADACGGAEFRLVAQPIVRRGSASAPDYEVLDLAMHLFYKVTDVPAVVADLRELRQATRKVQLDAATVDHWKEDQPAILRPHPGLRYEMNCGGYTGATPGEVDAPAARGPVARKFVEVLGKHAKTSKLFKITWATSNASPSAWSFGLRLVHPNDGSRQLKDESQFHVETFHSPSVLENKPPFSPFVPGTAHIGAWYGGASVDVKSDAGKAAIRDLVALADPSKTSFNVGGTSAASCLSCHMRDQTVLRAIAQANDPAVHSEATLAALAGVTLPAVTMWKPFEDALQARELTNVRNFGYAPTFDIGVSRRSINEAEAIRIFVKDKVKTAVPAEVTSALPAKIDYARDVKPILEARCGYCHPGKRAPDLLDSDSISAHQVYDMVTADFATSLQMPPGKQLPAAEGKVLERWMMQEAAADTIPK